MTLLDVMQARRSIRKFKTDPVPEQYINELIEAGRLAPSGTNIQPARYVIIKSDDARAKLAGCTSLPFVAAAPVIIACCVDTQAISKTGDRVKQLREAGAFAGTPLEKESTTSYSKNRESMDINAIRPYLNLNVAIAIDHITLRAVDLGLGSCWVMMFDQEKTSKLLDLDERYEVVALLPIGYPDQAPSPRPRVDMDDLVLKEI